MELSSSRSLPHRAIMQRSDPLLSNIPLVPYPRLPSPAIAVLVLFQRCFGGRPRKPCGKTRCPRQAIPTADREDPNRISRPRTAIGGAFHARRGSRTKTTCTTNGTSIRAAGPPPKLWYLVLLGLVFLARPPLSPEVKLSSPRAIKLPPRRAPEHIHA